MLANLTGAMLTQSASSLIDATARGGRLIVSGFTDAERDEVVSVFVPPLVPVADRSEQGWGCLVLGRPA